MNATRPPLGRGPLSWVVAWRFLRGQRSRLLDGTARAALAATALGVTAMIIAMALMTGYREDLRRKLVEGNAPVVAQPLAAGAEPLGEARRAELAAIPGVAAVGRVVYGQGTLTAVEGTAGGDGVEVTLRGVEPQPVDRGASGAPAPAGALGAGLAGGGRLTATAEQLAPGPDGVPGAVLGAELARRLGAAEGDLLRLVALGIGGGRPRFHYRSLRVAGTFAVGFAEFDAGWAVVDRSVVAGGGAGATDDGSGGANDLYEIALAEGADAERVVAAAGEVLGPDWFVADWRLANRELFTALEIQQRVLFLVLGLIVLVSTFNVGSTLVVLVRERMRDIGVLAALGLAPARLRAVFLAYGAVLGAAGVALGVALGTGAAWLMTTFEVIRFDPEVAAIYFIDAVAFRVRPSDLAAVIGFALAVNLLACAVPAWRAARIDPSTALRYE
jgi:lipoprotein-releasing system permease protein